jgi:CubicO group peptidase (beta-lactamase class C family)
MSTVVGYLLERATDGHLRSFAEEELFNPLGIAEYRWWDLAGGLIDAPGGLHLRPRDMAKIGQLMLNGGLWDGTRIVSEEWVAETTRRHIENPGSPDYALHWWCGDFHYRGKSAYVYMASGHGGQKIFVVPDLDMVIVLTHQVFDNDFGELNNLAILSRYLLPAADPTTAEEVSVPLAPEVLSSYVGEYRAPRGDFRIEVADGALRLSAEGSPPLIVEPVGEARFRGYVEGLLEVYLEFDLVDRGVAQGGRVTFGFTKDVMERIR